MILHVAKGEWGGGRMGDWLDEIWYSLLELLSHTHYIPFTTRRDWNNHDLWFVWREEGEYVVVCDLLVADIHTLVATIHTSLTC